MQCLRILGFILLLVSCRSEESWRDLKVSTNIEVALPAEAVFASIASFEGLSAAVPDLFWIEKVERQEKNLTRILILSDSTYFQEELISVNDEDLLLKYHVLRTSLPIKNTNHLIQVKGSNNGQVSQINWSTELSVQEKNRDEMQDKFSGMQESFLYTLELLGVELEEMMKDDTF